MTFSTVLIFSLKVGLSEAPSVLVRLLISECDCSCCVVGSLCHFGFSFEE